MPSLGYISERLSKLDNWALDGSFITKDYSFEDYEKVVEFISKVGKIIIEEKHYPNILITGKEVRISLTTDYEKSVTDKDFYIAMKIDEALKKGD